MRLSWVSQECSQGISQDWGFTRRLDWGRVCFQTHVAFGRIQFFADDWGDRERERVLTGCYVELSIHVLSWPLPMVAYFITSQQERRSLLERQKSLSYVTESWKCIHCLCRILLERSKSPGSPHSKEGIKQGHKSGVGFIWESAHHTPEVQEGISEVIFLALANPFIRPLTRGNVLQQMDVNGVTQCFSAFSLFFFKLKYIWFTMLLILLYSKVIQLSIYICSFSYSFPWWFIPGYWV